MISTMRAMGNSMNLHNIGAILEKKKAQAKNCLRLMHRRGLEPPTTRFEAGYSIH